MKKTLLLGGVAALFAFNANAFEFKPYVGLDYNYTKAGLDSEIKDYIKDSYNSFTLNIGAKVHQNIGLELFYQQSGEEDKSVVYEGYDLGKFKTKFNAFGADLTGYLPFNEKFEALASLGAGRYKVSLSSTGLLREAGGKGSDDHWAPRIGAGLMYNINEHVALRAQVRYVHLDMDEVDDLKEISFGVRYNF